MLTLSIENFLERRLQTQVFKLGLAKSMHHARVLIRQRHIRCVPRAAAGPPPQGADASWPCSVGKQIVNVPSFMVRTDSQKHIDFALNSPFGGGRPGRVKRRNQKARLLRPGQGAGACGGLTQLALCAAQNASKKEEGGDDDGEDEE